MHDHLIIPGLLLSQDLRQAVLADTQLSALSTLLGRGQFNWQPPRTTEAWLTDTCGLNPAPLAALRLLGEDGEIPEHSHWLCADPVQISITQQGLMLADASSLDLKMDEAREIVASLNREFADLGQFHAASPERWYLRLPGPVAPGSHRLDEVVGRRVDRFLPRGPDAPAWRRYFNEIQVFLHDHPVNQAREERGQAKLNSVWFWGEGAVPESTADKRPFDAVLADAALARGCARLWGLVPQSLDAGFTIPIAANRLSILDQLQRPALYNDLDGWRSALIELDQCWLTPALAALKSGKLSRLTLTVPGDHASLEVSISRSDMWKFWRKGPSFAALTIPDTSTETAP